jgi:hypothetical protein
MPELILGGGFTPEEFLRVLARRLQSDRDVLLARSLSAAAFAMRSPLRRPRASMC